MHIIYLINFLFVLGACNPSKANKPNQEMVLNNLPTQNFYNFSIAALNNDKIINMRDYQGKKILIVNVASRCGYTSQYADLQKLNELHGDIVKVIVLP